MIMGPLLKAFHSEGIDHKGFISVDLIVNGERVYVSELNCCLRDLESQTVLPRLITDFMDVVSAVMGERLSDVEIEMEQNATVCLVGATEGDAKPANDTPVTGLEKMRTMKDIFVFDENTSFSDSGIFTSGGKVICITATGNDLGEAKAKAYRAMEGIYFEGMYYRKDIGGKILSE
jgi:phosphoribosylamine--glycine ligase